jgi:hypothetical protein
MRLMAIAAKQTLPHYSGKAAERLMTERFGCVLRVPRFRGNAH